MSKTETKTETKTKNIPFSPHLSASQPPGTLGRQSGSSSTIPHSCPSGHLTSSQVGHAAAMYSELIIGRF